MSDNKIFKETIEFSLDASISGAFFETKISQLYSTDKIYSVRRDYLIDASTDEILQFFLDYDRGFQYRTFNGYITIIWNDFIVIHLSGSLYPQVKYKRGNYEDDIIYTGDIGSVRKLVDAFDEHFSEMMVPPHHVVSMVIQGQNGLDRISLPVKTDRKFYPAMYPCIEDPVKFLTDFLTSSANVLVLTGPAGLGKSALINQLILQAELPTTIVFDTAVMRNESLYTNFIGDSLRNNGGLMIMEDSDIILGDREMEQNEMMSRLLNLSDGIVNTSGAKFVFSANITDKANIDSALIRPGRCFDVVEFRNLTKKEAEVAAESIGIDLFDEDKDDWTVAEIFNRTANRKEKKMRVGFV